MTTTMQLIAKQTVGSGGAASVTFSNIPDSYTDLKLVVSTKNSRSDGTAFATVQFSFNGVTTNRSRRNLSNVSGTADSDSGSDIISVGTSSSATSNTFDNMEVYIPNYTSSNNKSMSIDSTTENNGTAVYQTLGAGLWSSSSVINQITITPTSYNWVEFSEFWLYGISNNTSTQNATVPYASGGDVITTDGTYWYHAFKYSGTFTPSKELSADVLVVAGGGGAGELGGGGAGGVLAFAAQALTSGTASTCVVGGGGTGVSGGSGTNGGNSQFASLTAGVGGGGGVGYNQGISGGSGGGTGRVIAYVGTGTAGQGNNGGYSTNTGDVRTGGGGGGAGGVGGNCTQTSWASGAGGAGTNSVTNWGALSSMLTATSLGVSGYIAGGGGGGGDDVAGTWGAGGSGGGGDGGSSGHTATAGVANTGSGGGGVGVRTNSSKNGGSGLIVVRYAV
jgi:hypothetical protein